MTEPVTFLDALADALLRTASYNRRDQIAPAAVFWPDQEREWELLIPRLRERLPVFVHGPYHPEERCGPAVWLRCIVARTLPELHLPEEEVPIIYLPGISGRALHQFHRSKELELLAELQYRSAFWVQHDGHDWALASFMQNKEHGLGIEVRNDAKAIKAMRQALPALADQPLARLREETPWRAADFDALLGFATGPEPGILELIARGESVELEFKSTARWDVKEGKQNPVMEEVIVKTVAAFLNSYQGGILLIGVEDNGVIHGLEDDYKAWSKPEKRNRDQYEIWLMGDLLLRAYGKEFSPYIRITFHEVSEREVCKVSVVPAPKPVFAKKGNEEHFYTKTGNSIHSLTIREAIEYVKNRWG